MTARLALSVACAALLAACGQPPAPQPVDLTVPAGWEGERPPPLPATVDARWWTAFDDPALDAVMARIEDADDLAVARARLAQARAGLRAARASLRPSLDLGASASTEQPGDDPERSDAASLALQAGWEIDLFGRNGLRADASDARLTASEADLAAIRLATRAEAARLYVTYREAQAREAAATATVEALSGVVELTDVRVRAGLQPELDLAAARNTLAEARTAPLAAQQAAREARLSLESLLGLAPGELRPVLDDRTQVPEPRTAASLDAPVEVLARRPDLRAAEARLVAARYDAAAARADFWPRLSLGAAFGAQSLEPGSPFSSSGGLWRLAGDLTAPVLSFGRLEAARDGADARLLEAAALYRQAANRALSEVERALVATALSEAQRQAQIEALEAAERRADLALQRHRAGLTPLIEVLLARQAAFDAETRLRRQEAAVALAFISLNTALGLG